MKKEAKKTVAKIKQTVRIATDKKTLDDAMKILPDTETHAWFKIIGGAGTFHNLSGLTLDEGTYVYQPRVKCQVAVKLFKPVKPVKEESKEVNKDG